MIRFTLVSDGSSDAALIPILTWLLGNHGITEVQPQWADLSRVRLPRHPSLADRLQKALALYPCDMLFIHRDAEREPRQRRIDEIRLALSRISPDLRTPTEICVVPVRMTEAWLLFDEAAIKQAAGNRQSRARLPLPPLSTLEDIPNPKQILHDCLKQASGLRGRRLAQFPVHERVQRVAELIDDFSPLRRLPAFQALEQDVQQAVTAAGRVKTAQS